MKMLTSTALALIMFFIQDTSWKPALFVSASEDSNPSANRVDVEDYTAPTGTTRLVQRDGNMRDCFNCHYFHLSKPISYNLDDYISSPEMACKNHSPCHRRPRLIQEYSKKDVVLCLDSLSVKRNRRPMHIAFIGDSIVRHQYLSFLRWIPDYDKNVSSHVPMFTRDVFHEDRHVTSHLLDNLRVSFYWRKLIRTDLIADFKRWSSTNDDSQAPDFILLGITAHQMIVGTNSLQIYENLLQNELMPLVNKSLTAHPHQEIIWLLQSPSNEQRTPSIYNAIHNEKITMFNNKIRHVFKYTRLIIWDTMNAIVEEYLRGCALTRFERRDSSLYVLCNDFIHPGLGTVSLGSQLLINHICSSV